MSYMYILYLDHTQPPCLSFSSARHPGQTHLSLKFFPSFFNNLLILVSVALLSTGVGSPTGTLATYQKPP